MMWDRLENSDALQLFWLIPVIAGLGWYLTKVQSQNIRKVLGSRLAPYLLANLSPTRRKLKLILEVVVLTFFIIALARPQTGERKESVKSEGVEVMLLIDVSQSMLAEDVRPSRLELAKSELERFIDKAGGDKVGLVVFAGSAVTLSPLTADKAALKMFLESISTTAVSSQGTDFRKALAEARVAFERGGADPDSGASVGRLVIVASDGEDNEAGALDSARELSKMGVRIFSLAFGTERGGNIPIRDERGNLTGYLKDKNGKTVVTKVIGDSLQSIAKEGRGSFHHATFGGEAVDALLRDIEKLQKAQFDSAEIRSYHEEYQIYLGIAVLLALIELLLGERQKVGRLWTGRFEVAKE